MDYKLMRQQFQADPLKQRLDLVTTGIITAIITFCRTVATGVVILTLLCDHIITITYRFKCDKVL